MPTSRKGQRIEEKRRMLLWLEMVEILTGAIAQLRGGRQKALTLSKDLVAEAKRKIRAGKECEAGRLLAYSASINVAVGALKLPDPRYVSESMDVSFLLDRLNFHASGCGGNSECELEELLEQIS